MRYDIYKLETRNDAEYTQEAYYPSSKDVPLKAGYEPITSTLTPGMTGFFVNSMNPLKGFQTSTIQEVYHRSNGWIEITTKNSVYLLKPTTQLNIDEQRNELSERP